MAELRRQLGLDRPWYVQYGDFLARALQGDLGRSFRGDRPVLPEVLDRFPFTLKLTLISIGLAAAVGVPIGIAAAVWRHSWVDYLVMLVALLGVSLPTFWFGISLPGISRLTVEAIKGRDLPVIQGSILFVALVFSLVNLLVDLGYAALDPRIRYD